MTLKEIFSNGSETTPEQERLSWIKEQIKEQLDELKTRIKLDVFSLIESDGLESDFQRVLCEIQNDWINDKSVSRILEEHKNTSIWVAIAHSLTTLAAISTLEEETIAKIFFILEWYERRLWDAA